MDKIVFITGASSGIGAGCARKFASQGASLILNARNVNKLSALKEELEKQYGAKIYLLPFDVRDRKHGTPFPTMVMSPPRYPDGQTCSDSAPSPDWIWHR